MGENEYVGKCNFRALIVKCYTISQALTACRTMQLIIFKVETLLNDAFKGIG